MADDNVIDFRTRKKARDTNSDEVQTRTAEELEEWAKDIFSDREMLEGVQGVATVFFNKDGTVDFALTSLSWMEVLWCARQLEAFAIDEQNELYFEEG